jgi:hypothetical protein
MSEPRNAHRPFESRQSRRRIHGHPSASMGIHRQGISPFTCLDDSVVAAVVSDWDLAGIVLINRIVLINPRKLRPRTVPVETSRLHGILYVHTGY